jgi:hypothetical protein
MLTCYPEMEKTDDLLNLLTPFYMLTVIRVANVLLLYAFVAKHAFTAKHTCETLTAKHTFENPPNLR